MKKAIVFVLNLFIMYFLSTSIASALQDAYELRFEEDEGGVVITYCMLNKPVDQFVLPESINGKPVIAIASYAFSSFESADPEYYAQEIILPDTIQVIEDYAMNEIRNVSKIHLHLCTQKKRSNIRVLLLFFTKTLGFYAYRYFIFPSSDRLCFSPND